MKAIFYLIFITAVFYSCSVTRTATEPVSINRLMLIGSYEIPFNYQFKGTTVGGLSGIDYDAANKVYYIISDDRSDINPSRFYTAKINFTSSGIDTVIFEKVTTLTGKDGKPFSSSKIDRAHAADPEAIRYNARKKNLVWTSEGEKFVRTDTTLKDPSINIMNKEGKYLDTFSLPPRMKMFATERGLRQNSVFEGLAFDDNFKSLYVNIEEPMYQDGPRARLRDEDAYIRITKYKVKTRRPVSQYAYRLEPVAHPAIPATGFMINGVSDILSLGNNRLLVIERSYSTGVKPSTIRVFIADLSNATDISGLVSLREQSFKYPVSKKLLINMDTLGIYTDNMEGVTFGPDLPNGHKTLIFVSDNNFSAVQKMQFLLFEIN